MFQQIHKQEKEQFKKLFKQERIDHFEDRFKVLDTFLKTEQHVTEVEMTRLLKENGNELSGDFVKDTLNLMCRFGFARENRFDNGKVRYEHLHLGVQREQKICRQC